MSLLPVSKVQDAAMSKAANIMAGEIEKGLVKEMNSCLHTMRPLKGKYRKLSISIN